MDKDEKMKVSVWGATPAESPGTWNNDAEIKFYYKGPNKKVQCFVDAIYDIYDALNKEVSH